MMVLCTLQDALIIAYKRAVEPFSLHRFMQDVFFESAYIGICFDQVDC
jgi:hypothetical protein